MTEPREGISIRKIWLPAAMKTATVEYCWRNRTKVSPLMNQLIAQIAMNPEAYADRDVPPGGEACISVYADDRIHDMAVAVAKEYGVALSSLVRIALADVLEEAGIEYVVRMKRPRNARTPARE